MMSMAPVGLEPIADVAKRLGVSTRCMKRRLKKLSEKVRREHPDEAPLLVQYAGGGEWHMDRSVAFRHARGLVVPGGDDPWAAVVRLLQEMREETNGRLHELGESIAVVRDQLVGRS